MAKSKYVHIGLTEQMIMNYSALPPELDGWRNYRIEYGGHAQSCFMEQIIYLPRFGSPCVLELLFEFWQENTHKQRRKILHDIIQELEKSS